MKLVLHLIRRDAKLWGWTIALWAAFGVCAMVMEVSDPPETSPYFPLKAFSLTAQALLACALIAWIVQEDSARDPLAFWRSRPIHPGALLAAKLILLGSLFVITPAAALIVVRLISSGQIGGAGTFLNLGIFLSAAVLAGAALAACTKNLGQYLLIGVTCAVAQNHLSALIGVYANVGGRNLADSRVVISALAIAVFSVVALLLQYHYRRTGYVFGVVALTVVGSALIRSFWMWRFV